MLPPVFKRLSQASTELSLARDISIDDFAKKAEKVAAAVEDFFQPPIEPSQESPSLIGRVVLWIGSFFSEPPTARAVGARDVEAEPLSTTSSAVNSIVSEAKSSIVYKLYKYSEQGEDRRVPLDRVSRGSVLRYLQEMINGIPSSIFSKTLARLINNLEKMNEANNTIDWKKVLSIVRSLHRIASRPS